MKIIHKNKKAYFDYEILQEFTTGLVLTGAEVRSIRLGYVNLKGSYASIKDQEIFVKNMHVSKYTHDHTESHNPFRDRKLLLKSSEISKIESKLNQQGVSLVPLAIGLVGRHIKMKLALVKGKKKYDKREVLKARSQERSTRRLLKRYV